MRIRKSSGCVIFHFFEKSLHILLVSSSDKKHWVMPKGGIELGFTEQSSAANEAYEEAGVEGSVGMELGEYKVLKGDIVHHVRMFAMDFKKELDVWPEMARRERRWFPADEAIKVLDPYLAVFVATLMEQVESNSHHEKSIA